jgi:regulation of enolase protein 1 (concanavalin A-like superfamily)
MRKSVLLIGLSLTLSAQAATWTDVFDSNKANQAVWTFINPLGDASVAIGGGVLAINVPAGANHDLSIANTCPRLMANIEDVNFTIEAKFNSEPNYAYQTQGLLVQEDSNNFICFEVFSDGSDLRLYCASFMDGATSTELDTAMSKGASYYLRIDRQADQWTLDYSYDGNEWFGGTSFVRAMAVSSAGIYAGNFGTDSDNAPSFVGVTDYFSSTTVPLTRDPNQFGIIVNAIGDGAVTTYPDKTSYSRGNTVTLTAIPHGSAVFVGWNGDISGTSNPAVLTVTGNHIVTAVFDSNLHVHPMTIKKFKVKAGKARAASQDSFTITGTFDAVQQDIASSAAIYIRLCNASHIVFNGVIPFDRNKFQKGKYSYRRHVGDAGNIRSAKFDLNKRTFRITAQKINLTGLSRPVQVAIEWGYNLGTIEANEAVVNGKRPIPMQLLSGYADALGLDKASVHVGTKPNTDSLTVSGDIAFASAAEDLTQHQLTLHWGNQDFTIPAGGFAALTHGRYVWKSPKSTTTEITKARFNLEKCTFKFSVKKAAITSRTGTVACGITCDCFDQAAAYAMTVNEGQPNSFTDDFDALILNTSIWTFINPLSDAVLSLSNGQLDIAVPAGTGHDLSTAGKNAPRIMTNIENTNFQIETKFNSEVNQSYQMQGLLVEQDARNFIWFGICSSGYGAVFYAGSYVNNQPAASLANYITKHAPYYLRIVRAGSLWKFYYSYDGAEWSAATDINRTMVTSSAGIYIGNDGVTNSNAPPFTGQAEYFSIK